MAWWGDILLYDPRVEEEVSGIRTAGIFPHFDMGRAPMATVVART